MSQARDLLSLLLATAPPAQIPGISQASAPPTQSSTLNASIVSKPPPIQSVEAFNAQLVVGGKDLALRKAADLLKIAAGSVEKGRTLSERYWLDALKIRRGNWGLIPAPLPFGTATGRSAEKTSKDFLVSFSLEECMSSEHHQSIGYSFFSSSCGVPQACDWSYTHFRRYPRCP
jgi:mediator of RNA polymerase II transcription subunit 17, fungi type